MVGTSLATIVVTSISFLTAHNKRGGVRWEVWRKMILGLVIVSLVGADIAVAGAIGFAWFGQDVINLPEGTIGFVHITGFLCISVASFAMAKVGVKLAHVLPALTLKRAFGILLLFAGGQLLLNEIEVI